MTDTNVTMPNERPPMLWGSVGKSHPTGYGSQTRLFLPRIKAAGFNLLNFSFTDNLGHPMIVDGIVTLGPSRHPWGNDVIAAHMDYIQQVYKKKPYSVGLFDFYMAEPRNWGAYPHAQWVPVDADPLRFDLDRNLKIGAMWQIAMSRFGERVLRDHGFDPMYCPHGIEMAVFKPVDRKEARARVQAALDRDSKGQFDGRRYELGDKFLAVMVAMNSDIRKGFYEGLTAFKLFHDAHPDSVLYLHTNMVGPDNGENLFKLIDDVGLGIEHVAFPNQYLYDCGMIDDGQMNDLYNAADVLLHPSYGEGFGIPIVEAQAAGCPVIVSDSSAMTELCLSGIKVPTTRFMRFAGLYWQRPLIDGLVGALEKVYAPVFGYNASRADTSAKVQQYDIDKVFAEYMLPVLNRIEAEHLDPTARVARTNKARKQVDVNGVKLTVRPQSWDEAIARMVQTEYCPDIIDYTKIKRAVDVGAHIGAWSLFVKKMSPDARIVAIEAMPENAELCRLNCNGANADSIAILEGRAGYTDGEYEWLIDPSNTGGNTLVKKGERPVLQGADVQIETAFEGKHYDLFSALHNLTGPDEFICRDADVLKLDCEGGEFDILLNAPKDDLTAFRYIVGEYHSDLGNIGEVLARLASLGFTVRRFAPSSANLGIFCLERTDNANLS